MDEPRSYREAAPPPAQRFPLRLGASARGGLTLTVIALVASVLLFVLTGRLFLLFCFAFGPGLFYVLAGAPRSVDVHHDAVVVRSWLRAPLRVPARELAVEKRADGLTLTSGDRSITIEAEHFEEASFERCAEALRALTPRFLERLW